MRNIFHTPACIKTHAIALGMLFALGLLITSSAFAQPAQGIPGYKANSDNTDVFELDRNALDDNGGNSSDDWENVLNDMPFTNGDFNALAITDCVDGSCDADWPGVLVDPPGLSLFVQGSKDIDDIPGWTCRDQNAPDADEITNAYAIAYDVNGDTVVYFGADRFATNGTKTMGFWFLQTAIDLTGTNALQCIPAGDGKFYTATGELATHTVGDLLILADFTQGGAVGNVRILEWVGSGGSDGSLDVLFSAGAADCAGEDAGDVCATINQVEEASPWTYITKGSSSDGPFPQFAFMEGGINISAIFAELGGEVPCFSTFIAETRSSDRVNASQKDFVIGSFNLCSIGVTKECGVNTPNLGNTPIDFTYDVAGCFNNTGAGTVTELNIIDDPALDSGTLQFWEVSGDPLTSPACADYTTVVNSRGAEITNPTSYLLAPGAQVLWTGQFTSTSNGDSDTATATAVGAVGGAPITPATDSATCPTAQFNPLLDVTKNCTTFLDDVGEELVVTVSVSGTVCNQGDVPLFGVTVVDSTVPGNDELGTLLGPIDLPAQANYPTVDCDPDTSLSAKDYSGSYTPDSIPTPPAGAPQQYTFEDDVTATGTDPTGTSVAGACEAGTCTDMAHAECSLCPDCPPCPPSF